MKHTMKLFQIGLRQISRDGMLIVLLPAPFLIGAFLKLAAPLANQILTAECSFSITPWYGLADGMLICLTPMFVAMVSAFLLLDERDQGVSAFYQVTPAEGLSYLAARIGLPMIGAFIATWIVATAFTLSSFPFEVILGGALISSFTGIALAMMVVSIAGNRVEGLALSKLMGISFIGLLFAWLVPAPYRWLASFLPSFWIGRLLTGGADLLSFLLGLASCLVWIALFTRRFLRKI